jgi:hypothetical protein
MQTDGAGTVTWIDIPASIADGTILHATLRWDGVDWVENSNILINPAADIDIQADATTGFVNLDSPVIFGPYSGVTGALYGFTYNATETFTAGFVGGGLSFAGQITFSNSLFIYESFRGAPTITSDVAPGFAAYTVLQSLPLLVAGSAAGENPLAPIVLNAAPSIRNPVSGVRSITDSTGVNVTTQMQATAAFAVMTADTTTGLTMAPKFSTVATSQISFGIVRGLWGQNIIPGLFQPSAGIEVMDRYALVDCANIAFGGSVERAVVRSEMIAGVGKWFMLNVGGAESDFGLGDIHLDNSTFMKFGNTISDPGMVLFWDPGTGQFRFSTFFDVGGSPLALNSTSASEWRLGQLNDSFRIGLQIDVNAISFGTVTATPDDANWFALYGAPNLRTPNVPGEYADILYSAAGSLDIDGLAMSEVSSLKVNSLGILLSGGSIDDLANVRIEGMASFGATLVHSLQMTGRFTLDGAISYGSESPAQLLANTNNWSLAPNNAMRTIVLMDSDGAYNITGILSSFGFAQDGDQRTIINTSAFIMTFTDEDVLSDAANRFQNANNGPITVAPGGSATYRYEGGVSRWQQLYLTGTYLEEADADLLYLRLDTTNDPLTNNLDGVSFNSVVLTAAGVATNFLNEAGAYSVPVGLLPTPTANKMLYADGANWLATTALEWDEANSTLTIDGAPGALQPAIDIINVDPSGIILQIGGVGSGSTNWAIYRTTDQSGSFFWELIDDHGLSSANHRLYWRNEGGLKFLEFDRSGEIRIGGSESTEKIFVDMNAEVVAVRNDATFYIEELAAANPEVSAHGQFWVRDDVPNVPMYTDDTGVDYNLLEVQGGSSIIAAYRFQTSIVEADPGNGNLRYDNATPASVTELFISSTTDNGVDLQNILSFISAGDRIYFQQDNDASKYLLFDITVNVDNGGWFSFAGTVSNSGTIPDSNAKCHILILFGASASGVASVSGGTNINVSGTAADPIVNLDVAVLGISVNGVTLSTAGAATSYLDETGAYSVPAGGGQVDSVSGGTNINVTGTAADPIVNLDAAVLGTSVNGVTLSNAGAATSYLDETGAYSVPAGAGIQATPTPAVGEIAIWDSTGATLTGDPNLTFIGSAFSITGFLAVSSTVNFDSLFYIQQMGAAGADVPTYGQAWYDSADDRLKWTPDTGVDNILAYVSELGGQVDSVSGGTNINVSGTAADPIVNLDAAITGVSVNAVTLNAAGAATEYLDETGAYSVPAGSGGVAPGATTGSILRWSGAAWLENTNVNIQGSGLFELTRSGAILRLRTTGASLNENVTDIRMENFSGFVIQAITDGGSNSNFLMNANRTGVVWQNLQMSVSTEIFGSLYLDDNDGPLANLAGRGQLYVLAADDTLHYRDETGSDFDLTLSGGQVDSVAGGTNINVSGTGVDPIVNLDAAITGVSVNAVTLTAAGAATNFLNETGAYSVPPSSGITATPTPASGEVTVWDSTGATVTGFPALTFDGTELSSPELTATGNGVGSGASLQVKGTTSVGIYLEGGGGVADERNWAISNINNGTFAILPYSDIDVAGSAILAANRVGNTVDIITMVASATIALSAPVVTATEVTATTFNDVPLTDAGVITNFLNETGTYTVPPASAGDVVKVGTPVDNQLGIWTGDGTIEGDADITWSGSQLLIGDDGVGGIVLDLRDGNTTGNAATVSVVFTDQISTIQGSVGTFPFFNLFHILGEASVQISAQGGEQTISMSGFLRCRLATAAEFDDITDPINTDIGKQQGCQCYDTTNDVPVWSTGTGAGDVWVNGVGTTVRTPV